MITELFENSFSFLLKYNYRIASYKDNTVVFISDSNCVELYYSEYEFEIGCIFSSRDKTKEFTLQEYIDYLGLTEHRGIYQLRDRGAKDIENAVNYLAFVVQKAYSIMDISVPESFNQVFGFVNTKREIKLRDYYVREELKLADRLWKEGKITQAADIYERNKDYLSKTQIKRIHYAKKHAEIER